MSDTKNDIESLRNRISSGETTARAVVESSANAAENLNESLNAFLEIDRAGALKRAEEITSATNLPLAGIPIAIKDNLCVRGMQTSCGSRILGDYHPPYDATVIERLLGAGAIVVGKTNCDEFAMGSSNENSAFGPVKNPWDMLRVPGGSSGGSAAAVAGGRVAVGIGDALWGSARLPGPLWGVARLRTHAAKHSRHRLVGLAVSLDLVDVVQH